MARLDRADDLTMAAYNCNQSYFDPAGVPDWAVKFQAWTGWRPYEAGGGGGVTEYWINKVWDPGGGGGWEYWETTPLPDPAGASYPDPHGTGFGGCSGYRVAGRRYV